MSIPPSANFSAADVMESAPEASLAIDVNRRLLNRYRFIAHESMFLLAGWLPKTARFELKCEFGRMLWEASLQVDAYYRRLREIQSPAFQTPDDAALVTAMMESAHAPDETALLLSFQAVLVPQVIAALRIHETATFPNSDFPSVHSIRHALVDLNDQHARLTSLVESARAAGKITAATEQWVAYITGLFAAAGGIGGAQEPTMAAPSPPACRLPFKIPAEAARDERFVHRGAAFAALTKEEDYESHTHEEFERYATEMLAAETVAVVLHASPAMPWEFQLDTARHLYDEVRHCLMGFEWMRRHGQDPFLSPQFLQVYRWRTQFPPELQYCMLTMGNEVHAFPYRHRRVEAHQKAADTLSEQFVRYDIADETQHVRFGHRWLPELLKHAGETRSVKDYTASALELWNTQYRSGKLPYNVE